MWLTTIICTDSLLWKLVLSVISFKDNIYGRLYSASVFVEMGSSCINLALLVNYSLRNIHGWFSLQLYKAKKDSDYIASFFFGK